MTESTTGEWLKIRPKPCKIGRRRSSTSRILSFVGYRVLDPFHQVTFEFVQPPDLG